MKTYILQYRDSIYKWHNVVDDDGFPIEFVTKQSALFVAKKLSELCDYPVSHQNWLICASNGVKYVCNWFGEIKLQTPVQEVLSRIGPPAYKRQMTVKEIENAQN